MTGSRFIPACAGNRIERPRVSTTDPVHPRVCGEQQIALKKRGLASGSSPRVRGTVYEWRGHAARYRFIPACAGNSIWPVEPPRPRPVHPRVCGEQLSAPRWLPRSNGSSPRVRGTVSAKRTSLSPSRFIPACAGNRQGTEFERVRRSVHPRVCGEQPPKFQRRGRPSGSSPRVRGTAQ